MKKYLLSICIPTYNRGSSLKRLINSIVSQKGFSDEISIVINDGPSKDDTQEMVKEFQKTYSNIYYARNDVATGMLPAILESIEMSNGEYTWLFGSDDFMQENALDITTRIIKKDEPTLILLNRRTFNDAKECVTTNSEESILFFDGFSDFGNYLGSDQRGDFEDKHNYFTFMSVFCFRTDFYNETYQFIIQNTCDRPSLEKHYFNYIVILFTQLIPSRKICIIESPRIVFCQNDNHNWKHNSKIVQDIKMLCNYVKDNYYISKDTQSILDKFVFRWWLACNIIAPLRSFLEKIKLYKILSFFWRKFIIRNI